MLYIIGGYGFDITANDYITHPYLIAVNLNQLVSHVKNGQPAEQDFRKLYHPEMAVTGGNVLKIDSTLYLTFGQKFDGRYSEMDSSGFFVQQYSNRIKKFNISDDGINLSINNYSEITDSTNFHRRDYNLVPQIFPDRVFGLTAFGGVFQYGVNLPYLNPINIKSSGNEVINNFNQYLNQYTTAVIPLYDSAFNAMHNIFLGGISEFTFDTLSQLNVQNAMVPFVKTISRFTRYSDSSMTEFALPVHMPDYLGTNAIFIPAASVPLYHNAIINLNALDTGDILIGYMISGILSTDSNISQISSYLSSANNLVYEIRIHKTGFTGINDFTLVNNLLNLKAYPIPFDNAVSIEFENKISQKVIVRAYDVSGKYIEEICNKDFQPGIIKLQWQPKSFSHQNYFIKVTTGKLSYNLKVLSH